MTISKNPTVIVNNFVTQSVTQSAGDHGSLSGLADDDHTQYIRVDGTRAFTGDQSLGDNQLTAVSTITAGTGSYFNLSASNELGINGAWIFFGESEGGTERLVLQGVGANDAAELFLQAKGTADDARITLSPDENTNNYGGLALDGTAAANNIDSVAAGSGDIRPLTLGITGSVIMKIATDGTVTFQTGSVTIEQNATVNGNLNVDTNLTVSNDALVSGILTAADITGSITRTGAGTPYLLADGDITLTTGANGQITVSASAGISEGDISHLNIQDIGTNTHAQIDSHIADSSIHGTVGIQDDGVEVTTSASFINFAGDAIASIATSTSGVLVTTTTGSGAGTSDLTLFDAVMGSRMFG